jgi:hypothetical protein
VSIHPKPGKNATRDVALVVAGRARDAQDLRLMLDMIGLLPKRATPSNRRVLGDDVGHGRYRMYAAGCRCDACRAKNTEMKRKARASAKKDPSRADRAGHGKANTYKNHGCRCDACREAHARWQAEHIKRKQAAA